MWLKNKHRGKAVRFFFKGWWQAEKIGVAQVWFLRDRISKAKKTEKTTWWLLLLLGWKKEYSNSIWAALYIQLSSGKSCHSWYNKSVYPLPVHCARLPGWQKQLRLLSSRTRGKQHGVSTKNHKTQKNAPKVLAIKTRYRRRCQSSLLVYPRGFQSDFLPFPFGCSLSGRGKNLAARGLLRYQTASPWQFHPSTDGHP